MGPFGSNIKTDNFVKSGVPVIRGGNLNSQKLDLNNMVFLTEEKADELKNSNAFPGDIVFTHRGTLGQVGIIPDEPYRRYVVSQSQMLLSCDPAIAISQFIFYYFKTREGQQRLLANRSQTGVPAIARPTTSLKAIEVLLPSLDEQSKIVGVLTALDDKIENNRRMNETLEAMAQAIFKDWFVDFGPVHRKASGMTDPVAILGGLITDPEKAPQTAALFSGGFGDNGLPEGWEVETLRDVLELSYGKSLPKTKRVPGSFPVYGSGGVTGSHEESMVKGPGIIVGRKGTVGSLYWEARDFFPIDTVFFVTPKKQIGLNYVWQLLNTLGLHNMNTDAAVPGLNRDNAYRLIVSSPRQPLKDAFEGIAATLQTKLQANVSENKTLAEARDYLLPRLMSGQIRAGAGVIVDVVE